MILDKANTDITAYPVLMVDDGYGGLEPSKGSPAVSFKAFALPVGFSGAGWAINSKLESQGWADVDRIRLIFRPVNGAVPIQRWSHIEFDGREYTVQEEPRFIRGFRRTQDYITATIELRGAL